MAGEGGPYAGRDQAGAARALSVAGTAEIRRGHVKSSGPIRPGPVCGAAQGHGRAHGLAERTVLAALELRRQRKVPGVSRAVPGVSPRHR
ncbi:hypothetical protein [Streptomyces sp. NBC_01768]|uniref:hypothetical protein n=1 Tax=Streptomyces sp. NBC_01768 TaxID=2975938 RepID=UPI002DDC2973|nr:hypothetical protein [Streptomyces sp. NBC_01768]WSC29354.1 hypothetical protein OG902_23140 [Streptomyces sp. NBC_01768]